MAAIYPVAVTYYFRGGLQESVQFIKRIDPFPLHQRDLIHDGFSPLAARVACALNDPAFFKGGILGFHDPANCIAVYSASHSPHDAPVGISLHLREVVTPIEIKMPGRTSAL